MATLKSLDVDVEVQPLVQWPAGYERTPADERRSSDFPADGILDRTVHDLNRELGRLDPDLVVLQLDIPQGRIRQDGLPYANATIGGHDPGVVLTVEMQDGGTQTYPCDTYRSWEENLRAIVYVLHDLRRISRHGVGHGSEQYRGFTALPEDVDAQMGPEEAARLLARTAPDARREYAGGDVEEAQAQILARDATFSAFYREAAKRSHPDRGDVVNDAHFRRVQAARQVLLRHHEEAGGG